MDTLAGEEILSIYLPSFSEGVNSLRKKCSSRKNAQEKNAPQEKMLHKEEILSFISRPHFGRARRPLKRINKSVMSWKTL